MGSSLRASTNLGKDYAEVSMRLIVGITGASGAIFGIRALAALRELEVEAHLILSRWSRVTISRETDFSLEQVEQLATTVYHHDNQAAPISSGSFRADGMIVAPCSMKTIAAIRAGYSDSLIARAADVMLKEHRKLLLLARESPFSEIHLENMLALARMGVMIFPPVPAFYNRPQSVAELVDYIVGRMLDQFGLEMPGMKRWNGM